VGSKDRAGSSPLKRGSSDCLLIFLSTNTLVPSLALRSMSGPACAAPPGPALPARGARLVASSSLLHGIPVKIFCICVLQARPGETRLGGLARCTVLVAHSVAAQLGE